MAYRASVKTTFEPAQVIQPIYTGGSVALSQNGHVLATCVGDDALLTDFRNSRELCRIEGDGESITTLCLTPLASHLIICSRSLSIRIYSLQPADAEEFSITATLDRTLKSHSTPIVTSVVDATGTLFAAGGADGSIKVYDIRGGFTTHTFHGHGGVISALHFFEVKDTQQPAGSREKARRRDHRNGVNGVPDQQVDTTLGYRLASGGEDGKIRIWNLHKRTSTATLDSHVSVIRSLSYSPQENALVSGSRDKTIMVWDAKTWKTRNTIPVLESVESAGFLNDGEVMFTGGETGRVRIWNTNTGKEITQEQTAGGETEGIVDMVHHEGLPFLLSVHEDQTLVLHSLAPISTLSDEAISALPILRRISGTHDEIIDLAYVGPDLSHMALATNLDDIRIISLRSDRTETHDEFAGTHFGADVGLLKGHEDIIICLDADGSGHWLATGAKDNTARLWRLDPENDSFECFATFTGHAESIGAITLPKSSVGEDLTISVNPLDHPPRFLITGSQDLTIKRWDVSTARKENRTAGRARYTRKAHDKDINALAMNPTSSLFASASQDRTVKIWSVDDGATIGVLRGHRRGVWTVSFAPASVKTIGTTSSSKGFVLTGSGGGAVRIWNLTDYSCLQTFEGHTNSVLKAVWLPSPADIPSSDRRGALVASAGGDGLVKIWESASGECATTLDNHTDRVWALAAPPPRASTTTTMPTLVSGGADGVLTFWRDTTTATAAAVASRETRRVETDQRLQNLARAGHWRDAIALALQLDQPARLLALFRSVVEADEPDAGSLCGNREVDAVLGSLADEQLLALLRRLRDWNASARSAGVAQRVLATLVRSYPPERFAGMKGGAGAGGGRVREVLDALAAYTERHLKRMEELAEESYLLDFTLGEMDEVFGSGGVAVPEGDGMVMG